MEQMGGMGALGGGAGGMPDFGGDDDEDDEAEGNELDKQIDAAVGDKGKDKESSVSFISPEVPFQPSKLINPTSPPFGRRFP